MKLEITKNELKILRQAIRREKAIFSGKDVIPSHKAALTRLGIKLWRVEF